MNHNIHTQQFLPIPPPISTFININQTLARVNTNTHYAHSHTHTHTYTHTNMKHQYADRQLLKSGFLHELDIIIPLPHSHPTIVGIAPFPSLLVAAFALSRLCSFVVKSQNINDLGGYDFRSLRSRVPFYVVHVYSVGRF